MFNSLISMLNFVLSNEDSSSHFANSITNHFNDWINKGWKRKIVDCYRKLTQDVIPQHLPIQLRAKYCEYMAEEQLLSNLVLFLFFLMNV